LILKWGQHGIGHKPLIQKASRATRITIETISKKKAPAQAGVFFCFMLLILTNSFDATTDIIIYKLNKNIPIFRLNLDLIEKYKIYYSKKGWEICDSQNRKISSKNCKKAIWRKPFGQEIEISSTKKPKLKEYVKAEILYIFNSIIEELIRKKKFIFSYPNAEKKLPKIRQLELGCKIFNVPDYEFVFNQKPEKLINKGQICKSLSGHEIASNDVIYTTQINPKKINNQFPWFIQTHIKKQYDITVFFMYGKMWSLRHKSLNKGSVVDWRIKKKTQWSEISIPEQLRKKVKKYMNLCKIKYGRLDFCQDSKETIWFLEVNPNGQFAWMDIWLKNPGSLTKVVCKKIEEEYFS